MRSAFRLRHHMAAFGMAIRPHAARIASGAAVLGGASVLGSSTVFAQGAAGKEETKVATAKPDHPVSKAGGLKQHPYGPNVFVLDSRACEVLLSKIRDAKTGHTDYVYYADRLLRVLSEECLARLPDVRPVDITTACGPYVGLSLPDYKNLCGVSIMRSGDILLEGLRKTAPGISVGKILIQRKEDEPDKRPVLFYSKLPPDVASKHVILVDPMLATGGSSIMAIKELIKAGVPEDHITFLNVVSCPEGINALIKAHPKVRLITAAVDSHLNSHKYIVPGLGDFGDRYYKT